MGPLDTSTGQAMSVDAAMFASRPMPKMPKGNMGTEQARKVAEDFEAVFLSQMMQPMFAETDAEAPFGGGASEKMWKSMQVDEYGKALARSGGIGIADAVFNQLIQAQEMGQAPSSNTNPAPKR